MTTKAFEIGDFGVNLVVTSTGEVQALDINTDAVDEASNLYFTNARARAALTVSGSLSYNSSTGVLSYTTPTIIASLSNHTTDSLAEGSNNLYFTSQRARDSLFAGAGISYNSSTGALGISDSGATPGTYGSSLTIPQITVNAQGQITSVTEFSLNSFVVEEFTGTGSQTDFQLTTIATNVNQLFITVGAVPQTPTESYLIISGNVLRFTSPPPSGSQVIVRFLGIPSVYSATGESVDLSGYATRVYVDTAVLALVDSAPSTMDTLNELAAALNDDANFAATVTTSLAAKADASNTYTKAEVDAMIDDIIEQIEALGGV